MTTVYQDCFGEQTLPPHVPTEHAPRERKNYRVNRTLDQIGVDPAAITARLTEYTSWCGHEV